MHSCKPIPVYLMILIQESSERAEPRKYSWELWIKTHYVIHLLWVRLGCFSVAPDRLLLWQGS